MAAFGGITCLDIAPDGAVRVSPLPISRHATDELRAKLLMVYTGIWRDSSDILREQGEAPDGRALAGEDADLVSHVGPEHRSLVPARA